MRFGFDDVAEFRDDDADLTDCGVASVRRFDVDRDNAVFVCFHTHSITESAQFRNDCEFTENNPGSLADGTVLWYK